MLSAIIVAAGSGRRLKSVVSKPLVKIGKLPVINYSLSVLDKHPAISEIIVVVNAQNRPAIKRLLNNCSFKKVKPLVLGGKRRQDSVYRGLKAVSVNSAWVLIHDAARPFIDKAMISSVVSAAKKTGSAVVAVQPKATIKLSQKNNIVQKTLDREKLWEIQTPQVFKKELIWRAYEKYAGSCVTDDAALIEKLGRPVELVRGKYENIKITTAEDLLLAGLIAERLKNAV
ncbi:MAG TPA: 2-C-methyl-D-erythritol 4-phosphate cytidylyltransferase [Candidatus Omnitrophota bacterium]|nr:2-C-methyl-D-erythritol 4-phosphate cytidylyltransferase [Candidatus Omnitrophota bacterium]HPT39505.1 2-C-methyl-D-erythritol 4-phosphate cytidylyltransferase [Candidatus Omnitrophota bacterium]